MVFPAQGKQNRRLKLQDFRLLWNAPREPFRKNGFDFLLQNLYLTAMANGTALNKSWSTFQYGTAQTWEALSPPPPSCGDPKARLWELLRPTVPERCFRSLIR